MKHLHFSLKNRLKGRADQTRFTDEFYIAKLLNAFFCTDFTARPGPNALK